MTAVQNDSDLLWKPAHPEQAQSTLLRDKVNSKYGLKLNSYEDLWRWSCDNRSNFWSEVWDFEGVIGDKGAAPYVDENATPKQNPKWFPGAKVNWAENQLRHAAAHPDDIAIIDTTEHSPEEGFTPGPRKVTQRELVALVGKVQKGLIDAGVKQGHRVGYWGGNRLEAVAVVLATSSLGAIFSSAAADFGVDGVIERLEQIKPHVLFCSNGVVYNGKSRPLIPLLPRLLSSLTNPPPTVVIINHIPDAVNAQSNVVEFIKKNSGGKSKIVPFESFISKENVTPTFKRIGFNEPIWILFSSGTTGKPKAIVHRQGGMLIDALREHHIQGDISRGDIFLYYTTPGWMMFQYLVAGLSTGATIICYEGSPLKDPATMWKMIDDYGVTVFGTSAKYIEQVSKHYPDVGKKHKLTHLKQVLSTGSPLPPQLFDFVYEHVKKDVIVGSITGGTDICSVFAGRCTALPVFRGEIQCRQLGFDLHSTANVNEEGELVVRKAFPIEPVGFWPLPAEGLPDGANIKAADVKVAQERFLDAYFKDAQGNWYHGDHVRVTSSRYGNGGGVVMLGRSDGVLNPSGIRFGPSDIYTVLETLQFTQKGVEETLVVGLLVDGGADEKVVLFVKMKENASMHDDVVKLIKTSIRTARSARHVPARIIQVTDIPMTLTGKKIEVPIRKVINGAPVETINPATLRNPECLAQYVALGLEMRKAEGMA